MLDHLVGGGDQVQGLSGEAELATQLLASAPPLTAWALAPQRIARRRFAAVVAVLGGVGQPGRNSPTCPGNCSICARKAWLSARKAVFFACSATFSASTLAMRSSAMHIALCYTCRATVREQSRRTFPLGRVRIQVLLGLISIVHPGHQF